MQSHVELTAESLWTEVARRLREALNDTTYRTWFAEARGLELSDDAFVIAVPTDFARAWIGGHFLELIRAAVVEATHKERRIVLAVREQKRRPAQPPAEETQAAPVAAELNPKYTFDRFVIGSSNRFAHAAALAVAESPARRARTRARWLV